MNNDDCLFCKIISREIPCYKIYEYDLVIDFLDINPDCDGHTIVVSKKNYKDINDISDEVLLHVFDAAKKIAKKLESKLNSDGISLLQNNGAVQDVKHFHLHIKPYYSKSPSFKLVKNKKLIKDAKDIYEILK